MDIVDLVDQAEAAADEARETLNAVTEEDVVTAVVGCALELRAFRLTVHAIHVLQHRAGEATVEPRGAEVPEIADGWYVIELMGHRRRHGHVRTVKLAGRQLVEVTYGVPVLGADGEQTGELADRVERYAAAAIYCLSESSEDDAREEALQVYPF